MKVSPLLTNWHVLAQTTFRRRFPHPPVLQTFVEELDLFVCHFFWQFCYGISSSARENIVSVPFVYDSAVALLTVGQLNGRLERSSSPMNTINDSVPSARTNSIIFSLCTCIYCAKTKNGECDSGQTGQKNWGPIPCGNGTHQKNSLVWRGEGFFVKIPIQFKSLWYTYQRICIYLLPLISWS